MLGIDAGQRGGQVIAQRHPVAVILARFLPREDACVRAVHIGQELAQALDGFDGGAFQSLEPIEVVDLGDLVQHGLAFGHLSAEIVAEPLGRFGPGAADLVFFGHVASDPVNRPRAYVQRPARAT